MVAALKKNDFKGGNVFVSIEKRTGRSKFVISVHSVRLD